MLGAFSQLSHGITGHMNQLRSEISTATGMPSPKFLSSYAELGFFNEMEPPFIEGRATAMVLLLSSMMLTFHPQAVFIRNCILKERNLIR